MPIVPHTERVDINLCICVLPIRKDSTSQDTRWCRDAAELITRTCGIASGAADGILLDLGVSSMQVGVIVVLYSVLCKQYIGSFTYLFVYFKAAAKPSRTSIDAHRVAVLDRVIIIGHASDHDWSAMTTSAVVSTNKAF